MPLGYHGQLTSVHTHSAEVPTSGDVTAHQGGGRSHDGEEAGDKRVGAVLVRVGLFAVRDALLSTLGLGPLLAPLALLALLPSSNQLLVLLYTP